MTYCLHCDLDYGNCSETCTSCGSPTVSYEAAFKFTMDKMKEWEHLHEENEAALKAAEDAYGEDL